jgi:hypothetical protein
MMMDMIVDSSRVDLADIGKVQEGRRWPAIGRARGVEATATQQQQKQRQQQQAAMDLGGGLGGWEGVDMDMDGLS